MADLGLSSILGLVSLASLTPMTAVAFANWLRMKKLRKVSEPSPGIKQVSLLIPARNEAENLVSQIGHLIEEARSKGIEVLLLNDQSTDSTAAEARKRGAKVIEGQALPAGWTGKNWACHQIAELAQGEYLLFIDADVRASLAALESSLQQMQIRGLDAYSVFPRQQMNSFAARALVPLIMYFPVLALLPLTLVERSSSIKLSAANGQWILIKRQVYEKSGGHAVIRDSLLDDVELFRRLKSLGFRVGVDLAQPNIETKMYSSASEMIEGFRKNLYLLCGRSLLGALGVLGLVFFVFLAPLFAPLLHWFIYGDMTFTTIWAPLLLLLITLTIQANLYQQSLGSVLLTPIGVLLLYYLIPLSAFSYWRGSLSWRGRSYSKDL